MKTSHAICLTSRPGARLLLGCALVLALLLAPVGAVIASKEPCTQYVNISPLPGGGVAVSPEGRLDGLGALQINIPVAYTPGSGYFNIGAFKGNHTDEFSLRMTNGTGAVGMGFGERYRVYLSAMQVSSHLIEESKAVSAQLQLFEESSGLPAISVGTQDVFDKEWEYAPGRAVYGVATRALPLGGSNLYVSAGYGNGRFLNRFFGGLSYPIGERVNLAAEWDGFQFNEGIAWRPGGRFGSVTLLAAYNNKAGLLAGVSGTGRASPLWGLGVGLLLYAL